MAYEAFRARGGARRHDGRAREDEQKERAQLGIAAAGGIHALVEMLAHAETAHDAARALWALAANNGINSSAIVTAGGMSGILKLARSSHGCLRPTTEAWSSWPGKLMLRCCG